MYTTSVNPNSVHTSVNRTELGLTEVCSTELGVTELWVSVYNVRGDELGLTELFACCTDMFAECTSTNMTGGERS